MKTWILKLDVAVFALWAVLIVLLAYYLPGCASRKPCDPVTVDVLHVAYLRQVDALIDSGACDEHERVEDCPAYRVVEEHQDAVLKGLGCQ